MIHLYFDKCETVAQAKKLYKELALKHHPDLGGNTATMQEINRQYEEILRRLDGEITTDSEGKTHTYKYDYETESKLMKLIDQLLTLQMSNVDIYLVGLWVWIDGETKPYKEELKTLNCKWHNTRKCWYFASTPSRYRKSSNKGIEDIAETYGATKIRNKATTPYKVIA
ncbi:J domain-containing protein [Geminocystis sp. NIES-3709]|uniref:J domain-containing protein n=1 Tax=Geminocystis sp. NIES-3709 TaxID=1617448 RepID=UPI0005FCD7F4|nr:J domain-containing protein [Geminocystis sp. NIES-3709]BAQ63945.1 conserved domain protein [Geminocystis sp. NIES-3709]